MFLALGCDSPRTSEENSENEEAFGARRPSVPPHPTDEQIATIFSNVEKKLVFPGCQEHTEAEGQNDCCLLRYEEYIQSQLTYPKRARKDNVEGVVLVRVEQVDSLFISEARIVRSLAFDCDQEALRIIKSLPNYRTKTHEDKQREESKYQSGRYYVFEVKFEL